MDIKPAFDTEVLFYLSGATRDVYLDELWPASTVATVEAEDGADGFRFRLDDWFYTILVEPDGEGTGFEIALRAGNALLDSASLHTDEFVGM